MEPNIWGPSAWLFLHSVTFQYPENPTEVEKLNYNHFFTSLQHVLPCPTCRKHYKENLEKLPIALNSKKELIEWLIDIHNEVNIIYHKKQFTYEEVYQKYKKLYNPSNYFNKGIILIILLLIMILYYYKYKF